MKMPKKLKSRKQGKKPCEKFYGDKQAIFMAKRTDCIKCGTQVDATVSKMRPECEVCVGKKLEDFDEEFLKENPQCNDAKKELMRVEDPGNNPGMVAAAQKKCKDLNTFEANLKVCRKVLSKKDKKKMNNALKSKQGLGGGAPSDDEEEDEAIMSTVVFDPAVRRSLVRLLMEDTKMPQHTCIQRLCDCDFARIPLPCMNSDEEIMRSIVTSAVNRQHIKRTVEALYPMLLGL